MDKGNFEKANPDVDGRQHAVHVEILSQTMAVAEIKRTDIDGPDVISRNGLEHTPWKR
jgi:hypothetical protein